MLFASLEPKTKFEEDWLTPGLNSLPQLYAVRWSHYGGVRLTICLKKFAGKGLLLRIAPPERPIGAFVYHPLHWQFFAQLASHIPWQSIPALA